MSTKYKVILAISGTVGISIAAVYWLMGKNVAILNSKGTIADEQRDIIVFTTVLMLVIVLPVFALTAFVAWRYREGNSRAKYSPDWDHNRAIELLWWTLPLVIISILSVVAWRSSHDLDPFKPLSSTKEPVNIQAVALQWRWLFIYPDAGIASLNEVSFPIDRPINFSITADSPMNSFWIPQLGGQIYAMPGMTTKLHLQASEAGKYRGTSANISGSGFSRMTFEANAMSEDQFDEWTLTAVESAQSLNFESYDELAKPAIGQDVEYFQSSEGLYTHIIAKYVLPHQNGSSHEGASH